MFLCSLRYCLKCYFSKGVYSFTLSTVYIVLNSVNYLHLSIVVHYKTVCNNNMKSLFAKQITPFFNSCFFLCYNVFIVLVS